MRKNVKKNAHSPRYLELAKAVDKDTLLDINSAVALVKQIANAKFVESIDLAIRLGIDPRKSDQNVRGITNLPHGTGKTKIVAVLAKGDMAKDASAAGADIVGDEDLIKKIQSGDKDLKFDVILATEEMAPQIGKIGKALGPKTPNKRNGTVTNNIGTAVKEIKAATRVEYRTDKAGVVHMSIGKVNFTDDQIVENFKAGFGAVLKAKPSSAKGKYVESITLSSTMGPGVALDANLASKFAG
ncbi:MAG TPA: 50S ribosomal protein L1 [Fimbriimonadaceae bacterium]|nr:50S ribosomal protein L1 [Fimbriimonadaceae bacterium]